MLTLAYINRNNSNGYNQVLLNVLHFINNNFKISFQYIDRYYGYKL